MIRTARAALNKELVGARTDLLHRYIRTLGAELKKKRRLTDSVIKYTVNVIFFLNFSNFSLAANSINGIFLMKSRSRENKKETPRHY